ncbi:glycosyltransferase [Motilimonas sp. 1_MG-2023]|uniref:glycosyltransferase n=1 Tax=Motilimonas sp. 1_MG-2023 TaxID=3062672 RepID=UPI0026E16D12|nr:glycosyltransferase [Motilimonas sp. 1_MG-2023]MDO6525358.1 glycosyltransferase [Motilimonas sp. 1_MG-2023]
MLQTGISVIIPTYNRAKLLEGTLASLEQQINAICPFEVIVVDDGSSDNTEAVVNSFRHVLNIQYQYQPDMGFRAGMARNKGIYAANYEICLFLDAGIVVPNNLLHSHYQAYQSKPQDVLIGMCYGFEEFELKNEASLLALYQQQPLNKVFKTLQASTEYLDCRYAILNNLPNGLNQSRYPWFVAWTCHLSAKTTLLRKVEGFDEHFNTWGGEDFELGIRLAKQGAKFDLLKSPLVLHLPHDKSAQGSQQSGQENLKYIIKKHPDIAEDVLLLNWTQGIQL